MTNLKALKKLIEKLTNKESKSGTTAKAIAEIAENCPSGLFLNDFTKAYQIESVVGELDGVSNTNVVQISDGDIDAGAYIYIMYHKNDSSIDTPDEVNIGTLVAPCTASDAAMKVSEIAHSTENAKILYESVEDGSEIVPMKLGFTAESGEFTLFLFKLL